MRFLMLIIISTLFLMATPYKTIHLDIHSKVFPKILLTDTKIEDKLVKGTIKVIILYTPEDKKVAKKLQKMMLDFYPHIKAYPFHVLLREYQHFDPTEAATAYYQLLGEKDSLIRINKQIQKRSLITFSYDNSYLDYGTLMSLHMGKKVSPYISIDALKKSGIVLDNIIYKVAKVK